ncbi:hypothetical protein [Streptomyces griseoaurantiacus]|uniref:hypothetical protein n=1 Tax=Streptomyces griseoaurantiacus TaxID=68213 RepID=UPI003460213D
MDYERELAEIERQLLTQDPDLAAELDTFGDITKARRAPCPPTPATAPEAPPAPARTRTARRRRRLVIAACVAVALIVIALTSALGAGAATHRPDHRAPRPGHALQDDPVPGGLADRA